MITRADLSRIKHIAILASVATLLTGALIRGDERQTTATSTLTGVATSYQVYAIRYATASGVKVADLVAGADPAQALDIPFMVWVLKGTGGRNVLVDAGSRGPRFEEWELHDFVKPSIAISKVGLSPDQITDIIITHIHWDHVGGADFFPKARVWIQRAEFDHYIDAQGKPRFDAIAPEDAAMLNNLWKSGRLMLVDGDSHKIIPGIVVYTGGKHTYASQYVGVATAAGTVVVASDCLYMYENLDKHLPLGLTEDREADLRAQERMLSIASTPRLIVPGHDPAVFKRFPKPGGGVAKIE